MTTKALIPDDWDQASYSLMIACIPNSPMWLATYTGLIYAPTWWHFWDGKTGSINGAKAVANDVYRSLCMANCDDILAALDRIADALEAIQIGAPVAGDNQEFKEILDSINEILGGASVVEPETIP